MSESPKGTKKKDAKQIVINCLAKHGSLNMYKIQKLSALYYSSVHKAVKELVLELSVQAVEDITSQKNAKITLFGLTFIGFQKYLANYSALSQINPLYVWGEPFNIRQERDYKRLFLDEVNDLRDQISELLDIIQSNGDALDYELFKQIKWLSQRYKAIPWITLEAAKSVSICTPFTSTVPTLIAQTRKSIERLEQEKKKFNDPIIQRAFSKNDQDSPYELNEKKLSYARENLGNLLEAEDRSRRIEYAKNFAFLASGLAESINESNKHLADFFKQIAEEGRRLYVTPAQRLVDSFD